MLFSTLFFALLYGLSPSASVVVAGPQRVLQVAPYGFWALALWLAGGTRVAWRIEPVALGGDRSVEAVAD